MEESEIMSQAEATVLGWRRDDGHYFGQDWSEDGYRSEVERVAQQIRERQAQAS